MVATPLPLLQSLASNRNGKNRSKPGYLALDIAFTSFSMPPSAASSASRQVGFALREAPDREGRRGEERGGDDAKAKHDSPARKRSIPGSGDDAA
jgi:hypothetical protein